MTGAGIPALGAGTDKPLDDPRLLGRNITKYHYTHNYIDFLGRDATIVIHYLRNNDTGALFDFKFKDEGEPKMEREPKTKSYY